MLSGISTGNRQLNTAIPGMTSYRQRLNSTQTTDNGIKYDMMNIECLVIPTKSHFLTFFLGYISPIGQSTEVLFGGLW